MPVRPAAIPSLILETADPGDLDGSDQLLQTGFWGRFKSSAGWIPRAFTWKTSGPDGSAGGLFLVLERRFPGGFRMAYVPYGPDLGSGVSPSRASALLTALGRELKPHLSPRCFMIRFDLCGGTFGPVGTDVPAPEDLERPLRRAPYRVQPQDTVILPLTGGAGESLDDDVLMAGMHKKTRYNIRLAARKGVEILRMDGEEALRLLPDWYRLYRETGERDGISLHSEFYYRRLFELIADESGDGSSRPGLSLYMARHDSDNLAGIIVSRSGRRSVYMYGASSSVKRDLMPNHLLQWAAIRDARDKGASEYDFFGIPPADDPDHPMHGLWRFKTGFGGDLHHYFGAWDLAWSGTVYSLYAGAERLRGRLAAVRKKR